MVSIGNKATLVSSNVCQHCGKCCKEFVCGGMDLNCAIRFAFMEDKKVIARDSDLVDDFGNMKREVVIKIPCSKLVREHDRYKCVEWNSWRPDFCNTYPDSVFYCCDPWDTLKIQKLLEEASKDCPHLKNVSVELVQQMLQKRKEMMNDQN